MRPRSQLLSKRRLLLPTIREGTEESVRDLNEANTLHIAAHAQAVTSEDYLLSICHLAHPTFPIREVSPTSRRSRQVDAANRRLRPTRLGSPTDESERPVQREDEREPGGSLVFGNSDPLEYIYGHQEALSGGMIVEGKFVKPRGSLWEGRPRSRAHSIPRALSPDLPRQRKNSTPELHSNASLSQSSPKHSVARAEARRAGDRGPQDPNKQSLISQWISECRSAWREARARACMLPAIAEV
ncbi:hypothetical protein fugu_013288 [Takifugu bimaculatus]|uniref:Uncharacterized protein n=1 Tax=Takifugu bimaculatus TaxID=433685 RepID=A0A4Z2C2Y8_9TELE|nr:hypothetical protein fugu_013288 [Takifugu bimaculatus]